MGRKRLSTKVSIFAVLITLVVNSPNFADEFIVLDGCCGAREHWMQAEANRLQCDGHQVIYRPWWRWRSATRAAQKKTVNIIGYSLGGSRASRAAQRLHVNSLELIDPVRIFGVINVPPNTPTTVYRATVPTQISGSPVNGCYQEIFIQTDHVGMPNYFRLCK